MTLNPEFLWDGVAPEESQADFPRKHSQTEAEDHMQKVAEIIIHSDPDIINLVEVENLEALTTFNKKFLAGRGYTPSDQWKAFRHRPGCSASYKNCPRRKSNSADDREGQSGNVLKSVSKNYFVKISLPETKFSIIGLHLLAVPLHQGRRLEREAQADAIRSMARELRGQGWLPVVFGDFNDYDGDLSSRDYISSMPITNVLNLVKEMDPNDPSDDLKNAASFVPKTSRFTSFGGKPNIDKLR